MRYTNILKYLCAFGKRSNTVWCRVFCTLSGKTYYYLSDTEDIRYGDDVTVLVGKRNEENTGRVVKIEIFKGNNAPMHVDSVKYIVEIQ